MKVIFIRDVKGQGKAGEIKEVKDGYGKFLIQNKDAVLLTKKSLEKLQFDNELKRQEESEKIIEAEKIKQEIEKLTLQFKLKVGSNGKVFGSVSTKQISEALIEKGYQIDKRNIITDGSLSSLGTHRVKVELYKKISANLTIQLIND